jgi:O-antigen/teichoic acid export membrane protein
MKSILKATAVLSSASVVSVVMGLVSAKVSALLLGPEGLGYMGLLQSLVSLIGLLLAMGVGVGLVRAGARALAEKDLQKEAALRGGAWLLCWMLGAVAALLLISLRTPLSRVMLGDVQHSDAIIFVLAALLFNLAAGIQISTLNAHHRVNELARVGMLTGVLGVGVNVLIIWLWRAQGIAWAVLATTFVSWSVSFYFARRHTPAPRMHLSFPEKWASALRLLRFGAPYTASLLAGTGAQLALPVLVLHLLGRNDVGFYRAATAISVNYLGFLITAMTQDYYPRLSAAGDQSALGRLVNDQYRLVLLLGGPIILAMLALVPYLVPLLYTREFTPTVALLEWQLIGDIFRFAAWTMAFVVLARSGSLAYFCIELVGGASLLAFSWFGMRWFGLEGLGIGFLLSAVIYYLVCWIILRRTMELRWTKENVLIFLTISAAAIVIRALPYVGLERARTAVALTLAGLVGLGSLYVIWGEVGGLKGLLVRRRPA